MYCTGKTYTFRNGAAIDYDGYVADAAQALALIKYYEAKEGNTVTLVEAEGMPDDVYNGVAVTVKHFPGGGRTSNSTQTLQELWKTRETVICM